MPTIPVGPVGAGRERSRELRKARIAQTFDLVADAEYQRSHGGFHDRIGTRLVELTGPSPGDRVLDLGCGRGAVLFPAREAVGADGYAVGVDLSEGMVRATAADAARQGLRNVAVRVDDAEAPGFPDGSFEAVLSSLVLQLTPDPAAAIASARRLLTPGGRFGAAVFGPEDDPGWGEAFRVLASFAGPDPDPAPEEGPSGTRTGHRRAGPDIPALLADAGFHGIRVHDELAHTDYATPEDWWRSQWGGGRRRVLDRIPRDRLADARAAAYAALPAAPLRRVTHILYTTATRG